MNFSVICAAVTVLSGTGIAAEAILKTATLPPKTYNIVIGNERDQTPGWLVGTIAPQENSTITVTAEQIEIAESGVTKLGGNTRVELLVGGKAITTFVGHSNAGDSMVLTPWVGGKPPIGFREPSQFCRDFDEALRTRDPEKLTRLFARDARVTIEELTSTGVAAKDMSAAEFVKFAQNLAP